ncbi:MAG: peptide chain release factor N(5)-glutamine methyltransferase [Candidatus Yanofskybacteria bacterium]|nr:peptide chain release factor N(5)-glutamine methyltransferase [Candidatus Yanofskybacteria bacterium]
MEKRHTKEIRWLLEEKYEGKLTPEAEEDIRKLEDGVPVDYLIGFVDFLGCRIDLSLLPFIPRPETEYWAEKAIEEIKKQKKPKVLDLFSGSGCVGLAVLKHCPDAFVDFAEREERALAQIQKNAELNHADAKRFRVLPSDVFSGIHEKYDFILANPPYIPEKRKHQVEEQVVDWEPWEALFGGPDGLDIIRRFLSEAPNYLKKGGVLYMEFDLSEKRAIERILKEFGHLAWELRKDQYGKWRFLRAALQNGLR